MQNIQLTDWNKKKLGKNQKDFPWDEETFLT